MSRHGLIEAGGTKFVLGIADEHAAISAHHRIETTTPAQTIGAALQWFTAQGLSPDSIGIASFGPLDLDRKSPQWGHVRSTPKPHWSHADLVGPFARAFRCPVGIETDVNGAALAEAKWGAGKGQPSTLYITVGTGIGGGLVADGKVLHGISHPEMGHIRMPRHAADADFAGICPFHGDCLEGLASGPAIMARWGASLSELAADHPGRSIIAWYLGQAISTFQAVMEPARIVLGGGVIATAGLLECIRSEAVLAGGGYYAGDPAAVLVAPGLGTHSGLMGALAVALSLTS